MNRMKRMVEVLELFWVDILIGIILLILVDDIRWFLFFLFLELLYIVRMHTEYLRKMRRIFQISNEIQLLTITRKLKITDDEKDIVMNDVKKDIGPKKWGEIEKELKDLLS